MKVGKGERGRDKNKKQNQRMEMPLILLKTDLLREILFRETMNSGCVLYENALHKDNNVGRVDFPVLADVSGRKLTFV